MKIILGAIISLFLSLSVTCAQHLSNGASDYSKEKTACKNIPLKATRKDNSFWDIIFSKAYATSLNNKENKKILRKRWKEIIGIDVFYPYFEAKKIEKAVRNKATVRIFKIKGRPEFKKDHIKYIFKIKF